MEDAKTVLHFFEEISRIPRSSGDEKGISDYLVTFAEQRGFDYTRDEANNVVIRKNATVPDCKCTPVIIQGHTDMVYVRSEDCTRKYEDGLGLVYRNGWLSADGTTLGADNGIAVAFALALLDSTTIPHPDIEAVFTVSEEIGLLGASKFDCSKLKGKYMINMDTEVEGIFFTSCAGAFRNQLKIPVEREQVTNLSSLKVIISGLKGGHSGMEIHEGRANAIMLMARILSKLGKRVRLASLQAEGKTNAISNNAEAELLADEKELILVENEIKSLEDDFIAEYGIRDTIHIELVRGEKKSTACLTENSKKRLTAAMLLLPCGVLWMSFNIPGLVETSANPGYIEQDENSISIFSLARSSVGSRKEEVSMKIAAIADLCGGESICSADYPQWEYRANSPLRDLALEAYKELFGREAKTGAVHAGLECGFFDERLCGVDIISYGPDLEDVHTPHERASLDSIERVWKLTQKILCKLMS